MALIRSPIVLIWLLTLIVADWPLVPVDRESALCHAAAAVVRRQRRVFADGLQMQICRC